MNYSKQKTKQSEAKQQQQVQIDTLEKNLEGGLSELKESENSLRKAIGS